MKNYKYEYCTLGLTGDMADYIQVLPVQRRISPTILIKSILERNKEVNELGRQGNKENC